MGPFEMIDLAGNDVMWRQRQDESYALQSVALGKGTRYALLSDKMCEEGFFVSLFSPPCFRFKFYLFNFIYTLTFLYNNYYFLIKGQKAGIGWYLYPKENARRPQDSAQTHALIASFRKEHGITARLDISDEEIVERCMYPLINEGFKILEEGIAESPEDIDRTYVYGYGFPRFLGGPLFWAENQVSYITNIQYIK